MRISFVAAAVGVSAASAFGQWSDDFNRPNGPIGGDWSVLTGSFAVENNQGKSTGSFIQSMQHNLATANYADVVMAVDAICVGTGLQYVALQSGLGGTDNLYIKVQSQNALGTFDTMGIYRGSNGGGWGGAGSGFFLLNAPFAAARMTVTISNGGDTLTLDFDTDFNGTPDQTYVANGVNLISGGFGTKFGIGAFNVAYFDNWKISAAGGGCYPDCDGNGTLTIADFGCFQTKFVQNDPYADCDGNGSLTIADFGCFQTKFVQGCP